MIAVPYDKNGYVDIPAVEKLTASTPFVIMIGIRQGAGKTYGLLQHFVKSNKHPIIVRRTKDEREKFGNQQLTPLQRVPICREKIIGENQKNMTMLYYKNADDSINRDDVFGWVFDLAVASKRGFNVTGFDTIFFDECIPERYAGGKRDIENAKTFYNFLITLLSNDYTDIKTHPKIWCVGNSDALVNGLFDVFGCTKTVERMIRTGQKVYISPQKCLSIILVDAPENAKKRAEMPIMRVAAKSATTDMALQNKFGYDETGIRPRKLREYKALASFKGEYSSYTVWRYKNDYDCHIYVTRGAYPATYELPNTREAFLGLSRQTCYGSRLDFWFLVLHAISGKSGFYDSLESKQWFKTMAK